MTIRATFLATLIAATGCKSADTSAGACRHSEVAEGACTIASPTPSPDGGYLDEYAERLGCTSDFKVLASTPLDSTLSGARSVKVVYDTAQDGRVYFQNSVRYQVHYQFASAHLSGNGLPVVPPISEFNGVEYFRPDRRFFLGAVTYYEGPKQWVFEIAPYDTASAQMIATLVGAVRKTTFFGEAMAFHPTSDAVTREVQQLPTDVCVISTDEIYAGIDYQPLSLGAAIGRLHFVDAWQLEEVALSYQDIVVLDQAPNDISVVQGMITEQFQTPLSHLNVLARNRKTPNMGLRNARSDERLRALDGQLVELTAGAESWSIRPASQEEAEAFWAAHRPPPVVLPEMNLDEKRLLDIESVAPEPDAGVSLRDAIKESVRAWGGKAAQYSILARTPDVPVRKAFAVPVFYYVQFFDQNGFTARVDQLLADTSFTTDPAAREAALLQLRNDMLRAPIDEGFQQLLRAKLAEPEYVGSAGIRFRTSTNSEDLEGFPCAGCYESATGHTESWDDVLTAVRRAYASTWLFRTFEERSYYGVDHHSVGMALLVHRNFHAEEANGVAVTNNPFDPSGLNPAFYVNVQYGGQYEVVHPPAGISSDQFLYYFSQPNQPITYLAHSNVVPADTSVLSAAQLHQLGTALDAIHRRFSPAYGPGAGNSDWYGMDVEFKFDNDDDKTKPPTLYMKQARPYPRLSE